MLCNHLYVVVYGDAFGATEAGRYPGEGLAESSKRGEVAGEGDLDEGSGWLRR